MDHDLYLMLEAQGARLDSIDRLLLHIIDKEAIIMATLQEVKDAIAAEGVEVAAKIQALEAKIQELIDAGSGASAADLDDLKALVQNIYSAPV